MRGNLRWSIIGLVAVAAVINYIDRNALAVMWPVISDEIGADKADYALLVTLFMIAYAVGQSLLGKLFDVIGTRAGFTVSILVWSASIAAHAFARGTASFGLLRVGLGLSEAGNWPGAVKVNALWFPAKERAFAQGIFNAGAAVGAIVAAPLIALLFAWVGWRWTFAIVGVLGALWLIPWLWLYKGDPDRHPWLSETERAHIADPAAIAAAKLPALTLRQFLRYKQSWAIIISRFFLDPVWWLFVSWLPLYLADTFDFDIKQIGLFAWVPFVGALLGSLGGGWLAGVLIGRGWPVLRARKAVITLGGAIMLPALLLTTTAATPLYAVLLIAAILFGFQVAINNIQTLPSDYFGGRGVGTLAGFSGTAAVAGTLITTWLVPVMTTRGYAPIFALAAAIAGVGGGDLAIGQAQKLWGSRSGSTKGCRHDVTGQGCDRHRRRARHRPLDSQPLAKDGARLVVNYHSDDASAQETLRAIERAGGSAVLHRADVTDASAVAGLVAAAGTRIDILVNCAGGLLARRTTADMDAAFFDQVMALAKLGHDVAMCSRVPDNDLGRHAVATLRGHGVDTRAIGTGDGRMGLYFVTPGSGPRATEVEYDREGSPRTSGRGGVRLAATAERRRAAAPVRRHTGAGADRCRGGPGGGRGRDGGGHGGVVRRQLPRQALGEARRRSSAHPVGAGRACRHPVRQPSGRGAADRSALRR